MFEYNEGTKKLLLWAMTFCTLLFAVNLILRPLRGIEVTAMDHIARIVVLIGAVLLSINWFRFIKKNKDKEKEYDKKNY
ncbi:MAG: hypothetical protein IKH75_04420 [Ruminococcus sp.]|nr:hypothetical protein [Ruminococcus sp.]